MSTWLEVNSFLPDSAPLLGSYTSADQWIFFFPFLGCSYFWEGNIWSWELQAPGTRQPTASTAAKCFSCPTASLPAPQSPQPWPELAVPHQAPAWDAVFPTRILCCLLRLQLLWTHGSYAQLSLTLLPWHCGEPQRLQPLHHNLCEYTPLSACADLLSAMATGLAGSGVTWACQGICCFSTEGERAKVNFNLWHLQKVSFVNNIL